MNRASTFISTVPFAKDNPELLQRLQKHSDIIINPLGRKLIEAELMDMLRDHTYLVAGTEPITRKVLEHANKLKLVARVGIGLDKADMQAAKELGIKVCYTPDAPSPAVAELTVANCFNLARFIHAADYNLKQGRWQRYFGSLLADKTIGILGTGRIGSRVIALLYALGCRKLLANDLVTSDDLVEQYGVKYVDKDTLWREADILSLHIPLTAATKNLVTAKELATMQPTSCLINTSRGGIVDEEALYATLLSGVIAGAAVDVFEQEPYQGKLTSLDNCILTCHMGSMTTQCRTQMEEEAVSEVINAILGKPMLNQVATISN